MSKPSSSKAQVGPVVSDAGGSSKRLLALLNSNSCHFNFSRN
ncbi:hypothetical protein [Limnoglobus roseus]|nr:hypothetical protein [Limnoglobus roseus]